MLDITQVDFLLLCEALEDHSYFNHWWLDPQTGEAAVRHEGSSEDEEELEEKGLIQIEPISPAESYQDLVDFIALVRDPKARDLLERAISGRGAFRRFKDALFDFPQLREAWFKFHDGRFERRALRWLADKGLVDEEVAEREIAARPEEILPELGNPFDPFKIATDAARDLKNLYGNRLQKVILFGSWARGDAHPESDIDLLVVLDTVRSPWQELRRMDDIAWRHSHENNTVVTLFPVAESDLENLSTPVLVRAKAEGREVA